MRVALIGDSGVGKTSLILRMSLARRPDPPELVKFDSKTKKMTINNEEIKLKMYDPAGQDKFDSLSR